MDPQQFGIVAEALKELDEGRKKILEHLIEAAAIGDRKRAMTARTALMKLPREHIYVSLLAVAEACIDQIDTNQQTSSHAE
jgi:hypothetical protein